MTVSVETRLQSTCDMTLKEDTLERALNPWQCFSYAQMLYQNSDQQETKNSRLQSASFFCLQNRIEKEEYVWVLTYQIFLIV